MVASISTVSRLVTAFGFAVISGTSMSDLMARSRLLALLLTASSALISGCAAAGGSVEGRPLPSYAGHAAELFDDAIEPRAVGLELEQGSDPRTDALLRERTQVGDAAMRVRIGTLTEKQEGAETRYQLGMKILETLAGSNPPQGDFNVTVDVASPSVGIVRNLQDGIVGKTFIAFVRAFVRPDGDHELHFHLAPDTQPEREAIRAATTKQEH
jgi:hypothetical protein